MGAESMWVTLTRRCGRVVMVMFTKATWPHRCGPCQKGGRAVAARAGSDAADHSFHSPCAEWVWGYGALCLVWAPTSSEFFFYQINLHHIHYSICTYFLEFANNNHFQGASFLCCDSQNDRKELIWALFPPSPIEMICSYCFSLYAERQGGFWIFWFCFLKGHVRMPRSLA